MCARFFTLKFGQGASISFVLATAVSLRLDAILQPRWIANLTFLMNFLMKTMPFDPIERNSPALAWNEIEMPDGPLKLALFLALFT
jgi:hypothetical protein